LKAYQSILTGNISVTILEKERAEKESEMSDFSSLYVISPIFLPASHFPRECSGRSTSLSSAMNRNWFSADGCVVLGFFVGGVVGGGVGTLNGAVLGFLVGGVVGGGVGGGVGPLNGAVLGFLVGGVVGGGVGPLNGAVLGFLVGGVVGGGVGLLNGAGLGFLIGWLVGIENVARSQHSS
jgi:hypothetical protein